MDLSTHIALPIDSPFNETAKVLPSVLKTYLERKHVFVEPVPAFNWPDYHNHVSEVTLKNF